MYDKVNRKIDVFDWTSGMKFGHLLLPCVTAELSSKPEKGVTRLCLPFIHFADSLDPEDAVASSCALTWFMGLISERDLVGAARLCRTLHKMRSKEEDGDLWLNQCCKSGRIATAIKDDHKHMLYMYVGGDARDYD